MRKNFFIFFEWQKGNKNREVENDFIKNFFLFVINIYTQAHVMVKCALTIDNILFCVTAKIFIFRVIKNNKKKDI